MVTLLNTNSFARSDEINSISVFEKFTWSRKSTHTYQHTLQQSRMKVQKISGSFFSMRT